MRNIVTGLIGCWMGLLVSAASLGAADNDVRLVEAVKARNGAAVQTLLKDGIDVNATQADGATALHWAAHWDDLETAAALIKAGAQVNAPNDYGVTPLSLACTNGNATMVETLLKAGANVHAVPSSGETTLMRAALTGNLKVVNALLAHGANVNAKEPSGQTALMWAVAEGHLDIARLLIDRGADVRAHSTSGFTPLMFAARQGNFDAARLLLAKGADVNETAVDRSSVLHVATVRGHAALALFLLDQGANPNADGPGYTALHWTVYNMESEFTGPFGIVAESGEWSALGGLQGEARMGLLRALLAHGANPNARLGKQLKELPTWGHQSGSVFKLQLAGGTPFLLAAKAGDVGSMRVLLSAGADPLLNTYDSTTPLMMAAGYGRTLGMSGVAESSALDAVKLALELGGAVNAANALGETALHGAAYQGRDTIVQFLVDKGATVNAKNARGETPFFVAEGKVYHSGGYQPHPSTAELLRRLGGHE